MTSLRILAFTLFLQPSFLLCTDSYYGESTFMSIVSHAYAGQSYCRLVESFDNVYKRKYRKAAGTFLQSTGAAALSASSHMYVGYASLHEQCPDNDTLDYQVRITFSGALLCVLGIFIKPRSEITNDGVEVVNSFFPVSTFAYALGENIDG